MYGSELLMKDFLVTVLIFVINTVFMLFVFFHFSYWGYAEPNNVGGVENCVEIKYNENENSWNDIQCTNPNYRICAKNLTVTI